MHAVPVAAAPAVPVAAVNRLAGQPQRQHTHLEACPHVVLVLDAKAADAGLAGDAGLAAGDSAAGGACALLGPFGGASGAAAWKKTKLGETMGGLRVA